MTTKPQLTPLNATEYRLWLASIDQDARAALAAGLALLAQELTGNMGGGGIDYGKLARALSDELRRVPIQFHADVEVPIDGARLARATFSRMLPSMSVRTTLPGSH